MALSKILRGKIQGECANRVNHRYEKRIRKKLKNRDFSIICPNCIGGLIYHRLGMEFLSPTINLWMSQPDFLKFAADIKGNLDKELVFLQTEASYPIAMLGDIKIHFNHYQSEEHARSCWERRKARVCFDNLYLIMYDRDGVTKDDLLQFGEVNCKNRVVLSHREHPDIPYVKTMKIVNGEQFLDADWRGIKTFEKEWDFVKWLNT